MQFLCGRHVDSKRLYLEYRFHGKIVKVAKKLASEICANSTPHCGNCRNSFSHFFRKNFVKAMVLLKEWLSSWFDEILFSEREFLHSTISEIMGV